LIIPAAPILAPPQASRLAADGPAADTARAAGLRPGP